MRTFAESILRELEKTIRDTENMVLGGGVTDMERYRFLMGRLEGLRFSQQSVKDLLKRHTDDEF
jgi:hypothetical protein